MQNGRGGGCPDLTIIHRLPPVPRSLRRIRSFRTRRVGADSTLGTYRVPSSNLDEKFSQNRVYPNSDHNPEHSQFDEIGPHEMLWVALQLDLGCLHARKFGTTRTGPATKPVRTYTARSNRSNSDKITIFKKCKKISLSG